MAGDAYYNLRSKRDSEIIKEEIKNIYEGDPFIDWSSVKWHHILNDCIKVSKKYPNIHFQIEEEMNDADLFECKNQIYHFLNGRYHIQKAEIVYAPFDKKDEKNWNSIE